MNNRWRVMLMTMMVVALSAVAISCDDDENNSPRQQRNYTITGNAAGSQVVPAVDVEGTGTLTGNYNPETRMLNYTNTWNGLSGAPTGGGFYYGETGVNGISVGTPWTYDGTTTNTGTYTGSMQLTQAQADQMIAGDWYYGYNTVANTNGEVRGQITAVQMAE